MVNTSQLSACALLGVVLLATAPPAGAQVARRADRSPLELQHVAGTRLRYGQASWSRSAARAGLENALALPGWRAGELSSDEGLLTREFRHAESVGESAPASFVLETRVADSVDSAQELLIEWLAGLQSSVRAPSAAEVGLSVGDAAFAGRAGAGPGALSWLAFVRGNVAVRVSACDPAREPGLDLGSIALAVDQSIGRGVVLESGRVPARPVIAALAVPQARVVAGAVLPLELSVTDPAAGTPHLQWAVEGTGQGYVERGSDGEWRLFTTGPGAITLALEVTGSTGTWTRHELALDVLDD